MITLKDVQINSLNLYYTKELITLKAEAVSQAEKMHAAGDYAAAAEYSTMAGKISDELTARGETPAAVVYEVAIKEYGYYMSCGTFDTFDEAMEYAKKYDIVIASHAEDLVDSKLPQGEYIAVRR